MRYMFLSVPSTLWTCKVNDEKSASTSSHLNASHLRRLDFFQFPKQTAQPPCLIRLHSK